MPANLLESPMYGDLFGDRELSDLLSDANSVAHMVLFERKLALVQGRLGVIPEAAGQAIDMALTDCEIAPSALAAGVASSGVPVPALVSILRDHVQEDAAQWLHWGATSQDVIDTAQVLGWQAALDVIGPRLSSLVDGLAVKARQYADLVMAGRTRSQIATPITFGLRIAQWAAPLIEMEAQLETLRGTVLKVQFGGASGANTAVAPHGPEIAGALAKELGLAPSPPWHTNRSGPLTLGNWLLGVVASLDKMAQDLVLMLRSEISEVKVGAGGGSSTMPQKANPVGPETISVLAALMRTAHAGLAASVSQVEERDGTRWPLEWTYLPQMLIATGAALRIAEQIALDLEAKPERMAELLSTHSGVLAEQASFVLAATMPRAEAQALVKKAAMMDKPLTAALGEFAPQIDWETALDLSSVVEPCWSIVEQILSSRES